MQVHTHTSHLDKVSVITTDGRIFFGILVSCDGSMNLVLTKTVERVIYPRVDDPEQDKPSEEHDMGTWVIRGDTVVLCGRVDEELDKSIVWKDVKGDVLPLSIKHA